MEEGASIVSSCGDPVGNGQVLSLSCNCMNIIIQSLLNCPKPLHPEGQFSQNASTDLNGRMLQRDCSRVILQPISCIFHPLKPKQTQGAGSRVGEWAVPWPSSTGNDDSYKNKTKKQHRTVKPRIRQTSALPSLFFLCAVWEARKCGTMAVLVRASGLC